MSLEKICIGLWYCGVYIFKILWKTTLRLDISEVGYIAMHILGSLQKLSGEDIKIVLVNPYGKAVEKSF